MVAVHPTRFFEVLNEGLKVREQLFVSTSLPKFAGSGRLQLSACLMRVVRKANLSAGAASAEGRCSGRQRRQAAREELFE